MDDKRLMHIIQQGENSAVEFKEHDVRPESLAREVVAFSNAAGGTVVIGVADDGTITGVELDKDYEEWVINVVRNNVVPPAQVQYGESWLDGKRVIAIEVPKGKDRPYQDLSGRFYVRVGTTNRLASLPELMRLFQQSGFYHFDATEVERADVKSLSIANITDYFQRYDIDFNELDADEQLNLLKNTDILSANGTPTVAGLLIFGANPQRYLHNASISFAHYPSDTITSELIDLQNLEGTLPQQVDAALIAIKHNTLTPSNIVGSKRIEQPTYPDKVFRELIVNACVHRNYAITGSRIRIFKFTDRIEFISPGKLPNTVTTEKLTSGVSYAVNPIIVKFMENMRYIDKLGRGLPMVYQEARKLGKYVKFEEIGEEFRVVVEG